MPGGVVPLLAVVPGGGGAGDDDCGPGTCTDGGVCACGDGAVSNMTGPHCRSQAAGDALTCRPAELAARASDATCAPPTSCGVADRRARGLICTSELAGAETAAACAAASLTLGGALAPCSRLAQARPPPLHCTPTRAVWRAATPSPTRPTARRSSAAAVGRRSSG